MKGSGVLKEEKRTNISFFLSPEPKQNTQFKLYTKDYITTMYHNKTIHLKLCTKDYITTMYPT